MTEPKQPGRFVRSLDWTFQRLRKIPAVRKLFDRIGHYFWNDNPEGWGK
jgi:hypothetical protein